ncbi:MAG: hypothetical protein ACK44B_08355, partial [Flavobacteriales bacterium]
MNYFYVLLTILGAIINGSNSLTAQTLMINEVSNGPSGNQEYVEFIVIDTVVTYNCSNTTPPCIDIRGWIFDDNSGYHGSGGIAAGAIRFSYDPLWACVPLGTIILLYNDADLNPTIPPVDLSVSDGNCRIVAPISNTSLFERNLVTPGALACSYPSGGWIAGGSWNNTLLANTGDCARVVNLAGCEVFSVCWASANQNNLIYFSSGGSGSQNVWFFNDGNPSVQTNWTEGSAAAGGNQTPGLANNVSNQNYINQFNNGCSAITPLTISLSAVDAGCICDGSAIVTANGSIPGYFYSWYDSSFSPIGQSGTSASGLCPGTYHVIVNSSIGCSDTATVNITSNITGTLSVNNETICNGESVVLNAVASIPGGTFNWSPGGEMSSAITVSPGSTTSYGVTYNISGCSVSNIATVTVNPIPTVTVNSPTVCAGNVATVTATPGTAGNYSYAWSVPSGSTIPGNVASFNTTTAGTYSVIITNTATNCVSLLASGTVTVNPNPTVSLNSPSVCAGNSATLTATPGTVATYSYTWFVPAGVTAPGSVTTFNTTTAGTYSVIIANTITNCSSLLESGTVTVNENPTVTVNSPAVCAGNTAQVTATPGISETYSYIWSVPTGATVQGNVATFNTTTAGTYSLSITNVTTNCFSQPAFGTVTINPIPTVTVNSPAVCAGTPATVTATPGTAGNYSYAWNVPSGATNPGNVASFTTTTAGSYSVIITNT